MKDDAFRPSHNEYDWLGEGTYFWEANPLRGLEFAAEAAKRKGTGIKKPAVVGAVIDLGYSLDLTTSLGLQQVRAAHESLVRVFEQAQEPPPDNRPDSLRHDLDCAVINYLHTLNGERGEAPFDTVKGIFIERPELFAGSAFGSKNHIQIAVRNPDCIKGVFRVPGSHLSAT